MTGSRRHHSTKMNYKSAVTRFTILLMQNELRVVDNGDVRRDIQMKYTIDERSTVKSLKFNREIVEWTA